MGNFMTTVGSANIPEEKREAYINDAKRVLEQSGLFGRTYAQIYGHDVFLLNFPTFTEEYADLCFSYFEESPWESIGIVLEECKPYSGKIGGGKFNKAVQALYVLTELYSDTLFVSRNDSFNVPTSALMWLRYVLKRDDIHLEWRSHLWEIYERMSLKQTYYAKDCTTQEFLDDFCGDIIDLNQIIDIQIVKDGAKFLIDKTEETETQKSDKISMHQIVKSFYSGASKYKASSDIDKDQQLQQLLELFCLDIPSQGLILKDHPDLEFYTLSRLLSPQVIIKVISEVYEIDFWELWKQVKDKIPHDCKSSFKYKTITSYKSKTLTTEEFFRVDSADRLYWWSEGSDVTITEDTQKMFDELSERFSEIISSFNTSESIVIKDWQKRLIALAEHKPHGIYFFEDMFYEFFGNFSDPKYRAWLILLEEYQYYKRFYKQLHAVLANVELREKVFG